MLYKFEWIILVVTILHKQINPHIFYISKKNTFHLEMVKLEAQTIPSEDIWILGPCISPTSNANN